MIFDRHEAWRREKALDFFFGSPGGTIFGSLNLHDITQLLAEFQSDALRVFANLRVDVPCHETRTCVGEFSSSNTWI